MNNIWSKNKYIEIIINILIYLMSMNFLHYGQLILPIICLLIFIDRKLKFYVKDKRIFIVLCLFGISFFAFSYSLGFYSVMGICLPMAYYIGSNILNVNENNIKKVIYIIICGMITHYLLNFVYEIYRFGWYKAITKSTRYDIWLQDEFVPTGTATNAVIILAMFYYLMVYENNRKIKMFNIVLFALTVFYTIILRRRIQIGLLLIVFVFSIIIDNLFINKENYKKLKYLLFVIVLLIFVFSILYLLDIANFKRWIDINSIFAYIGKNGLNSGRLSIFINGFKYLNKYPFGGQHISSIVGMPFHDLLLNIYDYAGIIPTLFMICYLVMIVINIIKIIKSSTISSEFKLLIVEIVLGYTIMCFMEPLMTGSSLFLIVGILIEACVELLI